MDKVLVKVYVPSLEDSFEIFIPKDLRLYEIIGFISQAVEQYSEGQYRSNHKEILCEKDSGNILDINFSAYELGIHNGSKLVLI